MYLPIFIHTTFASTTTITLYHYSTSLYLYLFYLYHYLYHYHFPQNSPLLPPRSLIITTSFPIHTPRQHQNNPFLHVVLSFVLLAI